MAESQMMRRTLHRDELVLLKRSSGRKTLAALIEKRRTEHAEAMVLGWRSWFVPWCLVPNTKVPAL